MFIPKYSNLLREDNIVKLNTCSVLFSMPAAPIIRAAPGGSTQN